MLLWQEWHAIQLQKLFFSTNDPFHHSSWEQKQNFWWSLAWYMLFLINPFCGIWLACCQSVSVSQTISVCLARPQGTIGCGKGWKGKRFNATIDPAFANNCESMTCLVLPKNLWTLAGMCCRTIASLEVLCFLSAMGRQKIGWWFGV